MVDIAVARMNRRRRKNRDAVVAYHAHQRAAPSGELFQGYGWIVHFFIRVGNNAADNAHPRVSDRRLILAFPGHGLHRHNSHRQARQNG